MAKEYKTLMIPGPTEVAPDILRGMSAPVPAHYMDEWLQLYGDTLRLLRELLYTKNDAFIMTGSGSVALEGAMCSLVESGDKVIADEIFADYARLYGAKVVDVTPTPGEAIDPALIQKKMHEEKDVKIVAILHNVTWTAVKSSTGKERSPSSTRYLRSVALRSGRTIGTWT